MLLNIMFVISIILYVFAYNINQTRTFHIPIRWGTLYLIIMSEKKEKKKPKKPLTIKVALNNPNQYSNKSDKDKSDQ